jgi:NAD(P)-dependent dehydrogenase (short-subunit alcohol dehydrogenase family)
MDLSGKVALITGASTGIGQAIAVHLARGGADIVLTSTRLEKLKPTLEIIKSTTRVVPVVANLNLEKDTSHLAKITKFHFGKCDIFVHAAGVWHTENKVLADLDYEKYTEAEIRLTMNIGIIAPMILINKLLPSMPPGSKIINVSHNFGTSNKVRGGIAGRSFSEGRVPYFVSKQALEKFTVALAEDLKVRDIQVNAISPGDTLTPAYAKFFPKFAKPDNCTTPDKVAEEVLKFCEPNNKITGRIKVVK